MKLLTKEELKGIDSTSKTIEKWDTFFKTAIPRLGFRQSLVDKMYPYERGIPLKGGGYIPVPKDTGRVFFRMSWADKLCGELSAAPATGGSTQKVGSKAPFGYIRDLMVNLWLTDLATFKKFFSNVSEIEDCDREFECFREENGFASSMSEASLETTSERNYEIRAERPITQKLWKIFIQNSDILALTMHNRVWNEPQSLISDEFKTQIINMDVSDDARLRSGITFFIYCNLVSEEYSSFPRERIRRIVSTYSGTETFRSRLRSFDEVYAQEYLVVSLNPIDKFMCSTKQAFGSCMSIAKQDDTSGTASQPALGLPALFPTDSVFMVFLTPGKHKNMYWESSEWKKSPDERDPDKAYKYLKMTCRALTYQGTFIKTVQQNLNKLKDRYKDRYPELVEAIDDIHPETPRLMVGRQYSARGEDSVWQPMIEWLLAKKGISTSMAYAEELKRFREIILRKDLAPTISGLIEQMANFALYFLRTGRLIDHKAITTDKYGFVRGIYYDNIQWSWSNIIRQAPSSSSKVLPTDIESPVIPVEEGGEHQINVGTSRCGTGGVCYYPSHEDLDMFKVLTGKQNYSYINRNVSVCDECGELVAKGTHKISDGRVLCDKCMIKLQIKKCPYCGEYYSKEEEPYHEVYNLREITNPSNYAAFEPIYTCRHDLYHAATKVYQKDTEEDMSSGSTGKLDPVSAREAYRMGAIPGTGELTPTKAVCAHCGKVHTENLYDNAWRHAESTIRFKDLEVKVDICPSCAKNAVMCSKCRKIIFMDGDQDAVILLPDRRIICPDCIDTIRMKQTIRNTLKNVLKDATKEDFNDEDILRGIIEHKGNLGSYIFDVIKNPETSAGLAKRYKPVLKDIEKQINSWLQRHPEEDFPAIRSSREELPSERNEQEDPIDTTTEIIDTLSPVEAG